MTVVHGGLYLNMFESFFDQERVYISHLSMGMKFIQQKQMKILSMEGEHQGREARGVHFREICAAKFKQ
jgi:hypothetical protein